MTYASLPGMFQLVAVLVDFISMLVLFFSCKTPGIMFDVGKFVFHPGTHLLVFVEAKVWVDRVVEFTVFSGQLRQLGLH